MSKLILVMTLLSFHASAEDVKNNLKFKKKNKLDFESLLIEGENKRPDLSVVTGNLGEKDLGLLKLRDNFNDMMADDAGEEIQWFQLKPWMVNL